MLRFIQVPDQRSARRNIIPLIRLHPPSFLSLPNSWWEKLNEHSLIERKGFQKIAPGVCRISQESSISVFLPGEAVRFIQSLFTMDEEKLC